MCILMKSKIVSCLEVSRNMISLVAVKIHKTCFAPFWLAESSLSRNSWLTTLPAYETRRDLLCTRLQRSLWQNDHVLDGCCTARSVSSPPFCDETQSSANIGIGDSESITVKRPFHDSNLITQTKATFFSSPKTSFSISHVSLRKR